jgi:carboxyl-terminal processing protease
VDLDRAARVPDLHDGSLLDEQPGQLDGLRQRPAAVLPQVQDYKRAVIVGDASSFGKGTVQALIGLAPFLQEKGAKATGANDPGSLKLTVQKFYRASGSSTQLRGVTPDIVLPSLSSVVDVGERSLDNPLPWDTIAGAAYQKANQITPPLLAELTKRSGARVATDKDFSYLRQEIARLKEAEARKSISLNEKQRARERQEIEARAKARQKELASRPQSKERVFLLTLKDVDSPGLPPPAPSPPAGVDAAKSQAPNGEDPAGAMTPNPTPERDITLNEAQRILRDLVSRSRKEPAAVAKRR